MIPNTIVLLAEDDLDDQEMLIDACREITPALEFVVANTGSKALEILKNLAPERHPGLIVLDYNLPEISGAELLTRLKELQLYADVPKLIWSTSNSPVYQKKCMDLGAHSYIVKPSGVAGIRLIAQILVDLCSSR